VTAERIAPAEWPSRQGSYEVRDPTAPIAVCVLTSEDLIEPLAAVDGVAIVGSVQTANVGLEAIIVNGITNRNLRSLVLCGKDSKLFRQGQSLVALHENGIDEHQNIVGARGYEPRLAGISIAAIARFREQFDIVDLREVEEATTIIPAIRYSLSRDPGPMEDDFAAMELSTRRIRPGGKREPLAYDPKGYFVITVDDESGEIVVIHYGQDHLPTAEMRGRSAEPMFLGLLRERLISQLSHAGYIGRELTKAETALRVGLNYTQDKPLRRPRGKSI
jgi:tetrahydromethanopterin S-methyltransferase subunit A